MIVTGIFVLKKTLNIEIENHIDLLVELCIFGPEVVQDDV